jgi:hypothetical protein
MLDILVKNYLWSDSIILDSENKDKKIYNLKNFLDFILKIESKGWKNIPNLHWSWAKWFYQLHTGNSEKWYIQIVNNKFKKISKEEFLKLKSENNERTDLKTVHNTSSYETSIRSTINFFKTLWNKWKIWNNIGFAFTNNILNLSIRSGDEVFKKYQLTFWATNTTPKIFKIEWDKRVNQDVLDLWVIEQSILFLADVFERWVKRNPKTEKMITGIFLWDKQQLINFYNIVHNTDPGQYNWTANNLINTAFKSVNLKKMI